MDDVNDEQYRWDGARNGYNGLCDGKIRDRQRVKRVSGVRKVRRSDVA